MYTKAKAHFKKVDPVLHGAAKRFLVPDVTPSRDLFRDISWTIVGQQLSGKAADTIFGRLRDALPKRKVTAAAILALSDARMRACGISGAKMRALRSLAESVTRGELRLAQLRKASDADVLTQLTTIKGIGPWTAQMVLMFSLGRTDIFSEGDLGLKKGLMHLYNLKKYPSTRQLTHLTQPWSPYRTYAARVLWRVADERKKKPG